MKLQKATISNMNAKTFFKITDIWRNIWSYDSSYKTKFHDCLEELEWKNYIKAMPYNSYYLPLVYGMRMDRVRHVMTQEMMVIRPYLDEIGCTLRSFSTGSWYADLSYHHHANRSFFKKYAERISKGFTKEPLYLKVSIVVQIELDATTQEWEDWYNEKANQHNEMCEEMIKNGELDDDDDESIVTVDSEGFRHSCKRLDPRPIFRPMIYESPKCKVFAYRFDEVVCEFYGIKIPV